MADEWGSGLCTKEVRLRFGLWGLCKRRAAYGDQCWQHADIEFGPEWREDPNDEREQETW